MFLPKDSNSESSCQAKILTSAVKYIVFENPKHKRINSRCANAKMGLTPLELHLQYLILPYPGSLECKWVVPPSTWGHIHVWQFLSIYSYNIRFRPTQAHWNANGLPRLPFGDTSTCGNCEDAAVFNISQVDALPVYTSQVMTATWTDPLLSKVLRYTRTGWPLETPEELRSYWLKKTEIAVEEDCVMWGTRMIEPSKLWEKVLQELHSGHLGVVQMRALALSYVW